jgi:predicted RNase H-like HicB family nuclease
MASTLSIPVQINAVVHDVAGGGFWAEVPLLPGCVAQAETLEALRENIRSAINDWFEESCIKTEEEANHLAMLQGGATPTAESYPIRYDFLPPPSWTDEDD